MGALFRSEEMTLVQLFIQPEAAYYIVAELGERGCVQFKDLNKEESLFQREYSQEVMRINEMERQLRYIETEIKKSEIRIPDIRELPKAPNPREMAILEAHVEKTERDIRELSEGSVSMKKEYYDRVLHKHVLIKAKTFFNQQEEALNSDFMPGKNASQLGLVAGVVNKDKAFAFERMLWRVSRGTIFLRQADIDEIIFDPQTNVEVKKCAFIAFFQGENLGSKVKKVCSGFKATIFNIPIASSSRNEHIKHISTEVMDIKNVISQSEDHRMRLLVAVAKDIQNWTINVCKMKAIYNTLNTFSRDFSKKCLVAEGWVPSSDVKYVKGALTDGSRACGSTVPSFYNVLKTNQTPPTYNRTNKFTQGFENLISAYGISSYGELNPALYTIVTFPFLFAVMFGDLGHAVLMTAFGAWLVISEKKIGAMRGKNEIFSIFFSGRYIILLMGIFSMYTGLIYNDVFSKSMNIFGTKWKIVESDISNMNFSTTEANEATTYFELVPRHSYDGSAYFFGLDPAWQSADNKIIFLNSFKMKLSIIFGVVHMLFGVCLSVFNFVHSKKTNVYSA